MQLEGTKLERLTEVAVWFILVLVLFGVQLFPQEVIRSDTATILAAGITAFALWYYYVAWKFLGAKERRFLKDMTDIIFIGLIIFIAKDYGTYFFGLLFLPIAAAAFTLDLLHSLIIATAAAVIIAGEILLTSQGLINESNLLLSGGQIVIFFFITVFARFLALQIRHEREEKEIARARASQLSHDLAEERKLEAMERQFVDLASHQLFTPLSIIRGFASLLREKPKTLNQTQRDQVEEIYENSRRMVRLINDLRLEAKITQHRYPVSLKNNSLSRLIRDVASELRPQFADKKINLKLTLPKNEINARFDVDATRQIIWNLLENTLQYTPSKGTVTIALDRDDTFIKLAVKDTGIGIPHTDQRKIFQRFFRASNASPVYRNGSGLGLIVAKELAERQHGTITFVSEINQGSTFTLSLPKP